MLCVKSNSSNKSLCQSQSSTCSLSRLPQWLPRRGWGTARVLTVPLPRSLRAASQAAGGTRGAPESVFSRTFLVASWRNQYEVLQGVSEGSSGHPGWGPGLLSPLDRAPGAGRRLPPSQQEPRLQLPGPRGEPPGEPEGPSRPSSEPQNSGHPAPPAQKSTGLRFPETGEVPPGALQTAGRRSLMAMGTSLPSSGNSIQSPRYPRLTVHSRRRTLCPALARPDITEHSRPGAPPSAVPPPGPLGLPGPAGAKQGLLVSGGTRRHKDSRDPTGPLCGSFNQSSPHPRPQVSLAQTRGTGRLGPPSGQGHLS